MAQLKITIKEKNRVLFSRKISKFPILFGRGEQNHISFPKTTYLSRTHGSIGYMDGKIIVMDLNSLNGIYVNGEKISSAKFDQKVKFEAGDYVFDIEELQDEVQSIQENPSASKKTQTQDVSELTLISQRLVAVVKKLKFEIEDDLKKLSPNEIALQAVVTWGKDIFDVRQFQPSDFVIAGRSPFDPIQIPSLKGRVKLGKYFNNKGELSIPLGLKWRLSHRGQHLSPEEAVKYKLAIPSSKSVKFGLGIEDVCTIDLGHETSLHIRYVEVPRPFIAKTWIENKEIFKKAIIVSLGVHLFFSLVSVISAEKISAPQVENIPPRFAKLILDPPKMLLAPPPKIEIPILEKKPEPPPEPSKVVEEVKKPEPKLKPKPVPIPKVKPKPVDVKNIAKTKTQVMPQKPQPQTTVQPVTKSQVNSSSEKMAESFNEMFSEVADKSTPVTKAPIKIDKSAKPGEMAKGVSMAGVAGALKSQVGKLQSKVGNVSSVGQQVGQVGYQSGGGGATGNRKVVSGVLGTPKLEESSIPQGINHDQVMKVVNKHLNEIHRCYDRALMEDANLAGRVEYEWNINSAGKVIRATVKRSDMSNADFLNKCVLAIFYKMQFPMSKNGQPTVANIGFPFGKI